MGSFINRINSLLDHMETLKMQQLDEQYEIIDKLDGTIDEQFELINKPYDIIEKPY